MMEPFSVLNEEFSLNNHTKKSHMVFDDKFLKKFLMYLEYNPEAVKLALVFL